MPVILTPATLHSVFQPVPMTLWGVPCNQWTEEEKTWARLTMILHMLTPPKSGKLQQCSPFMGYL